MVKQHIKIMKKLILGDIEIVKKKDAGVGKTEVLNSTEPLKPLIGMICPYAVKFFKETAYAFSKCKITENQKKVLSNISQE